MMAPPSPPQDPIRPILQQQHPQRPPQPQPPHFQPSMNPERSPEREAREARAQRWADDLVAGFEADIRQNQAPSRIQPPTSCGVPAAEAGANAHALHKEEARTHEGTAAAAHPNAALAADALHKEEARTHEGTAAAAHPNAALAAGTLELDPPFEASGIDNDDDEQGMEMEMELHPAAQRAHDERTAREALEVDRAKRAVSIKRVAHICAVEDGVAEAALEDTDFDLERAVSALLDRAAAPPASSTAPSDTLPDRPAASTASAAPPAPPAAPAPLGRPALPRGRNPRKQPTTPANAAAGAPGTSRSAAAPSAAAPSAAGPSAAAPSASASSAPNGRGRNPRKQPATAPAAPASDPPVGASAGALSLEERRRRSMEENERMRKLLGIDEARAALAMTRNPRVRRSVTPQGGARQAASTRASEFDLRSVAAGTRTPRPYTLKFARLWARALYREVDEMLRLFLDAVFSGDAEGRGDALALLDTAPDAGKGEWLVALLFLGSNLIGCAFYRYPRVHTEGCTEVALLAVHPCAIEQASDRAAAPKAVAAALLAYVAAMSAHNESLELQIVRSAPSEVRQALATFDDDHGGIPESMKTQMLHVDGRYFLQLETGPGEEACKNQTAFVLAGVQYAERALVDEVRTSSTPVTATASNQLESFPLAVGELVVI